MRKRERGRKGERERESGMVGEERWGRYGGGGTWEVYWGTAGLVIKV